MQHDSLETLLLRHYGSQAEVPGNLEQQLCASVRQQAAHLEEQQATTARLWHKRRFTRREAVRLVAAGAAGAGALGIGLEGLRVFEAALLGQDSNQPAFT